MFTSIELSVERWEDFYDNVTSYPDREQRDALLRKVTKLSGCEEYTSQKLRVYFKTRRKDQGRAARALEQKVASKSLPKRRVTSTKRSRTYTATLRVCLCAECAT